jgi:hypothetical protein
MEGDLILSEQTMARTAVARKAARKKTAPAKKQAAAPAKKQAAAPAKKKAAPTKKKAGRPRKPVNDSESESESESQSNDDSSKLPAVRWAADNERLVWKLLELLKQHDMLRKVIWKGPNETTSSTNKISACKQLAIFLLSDESPYKEAIAAAKEEGQREYNRILGIYGQAVKVKMYKLGELYGKKRVQYGSTGAGLDDASQLTPGSQLANVWGIIILLKYEKERI